jgi:purine-binding chemotaxis protein CheW
LSDNELEGDATRGETTAAALRRRFDESFAVAASPHSERLEGFLAIRLASDLYVLRVSEIAGLHADLKVVAVPSHDSQLLGIVALRGTMAPVYDLAALLGYPSSARPRWIVLARASQLVGFAFDTFESHLRAPDAAIAARDARAAAHLGGTVRAADVSRPIVRLTSLVELIKGRNS